MSISTYNISYTACIYIMYITCIYMYIIYYILYIYVYIYIYIYIYTYIYMYIPGNTDFKQLHTGSGQSHKGVRYTQSTYWEYIIYMYRYIYIYIYIYIYVYIIYTHM